MSALIQRISLPEPVIPKEVLVAIEDFTHEGHRSRDPDDKPFRLLRPLDQTKREKAAVAESALAAYLVPATANETAAWLARLMLTTAKSPEQGDLDRVMRAYVFALNGTPSAAFSDENLQRAMRTFKFWPTAAEVSGFLDGLIAPHRRRLDALRAMLKARDAVSPMQEAENRPPPTEEARTKVRMAVQAALAETLVRVEKPGRRPMTRHTSDADLIAMYRGDASTPGPRGDLARTRIAGIEKRLAAEARGRSVGDDANHLHGMAGHDSRDGIIHPQSRDG